MSPFSPLQFGKVIGFILLLSVCCAHDNIFVTDNTRLATRRFAAQDVECILYLREDEHLQQEVDSNEFVDVETWVCGEMDSLNDDVRFSSVSFADIESEIENFDIQEYLDHNGAVSGSSKLMLSEVAVSTNTATLYIHERETIEIKNISSGDRRLVNDGDIPSSKGEATMLLVRISTNDRTTSSSRSELYEKTFSDEEGFSMASQFDACSYGDFTIVPDPNNDHHKQRLAMDLKLDMYIDNDSNTTRGVVGNMAMQLLKSSYANLDEVDLIQFCMPPGTKKFRSSTNDYVSWSAYANVGGRYSYANDEDDWCNSVSAKIHEVGHNLNLLHSPGDFSDLMGNSFDERDDGFSRMCSNAAKNYELGWYENMQLEFDTFIDLDFQAPSFSKTYKMIGVDDYTKNGSVNDGVVVLKLGDYYIGYNSKKGINDGVVIDGNKLMILKMNENRESIKQAALDTYGTHTIQNDEGQKVTIKFVSLSDGIATVELSDTETSPVTNDIDINGSCVPEQSYEFSIEIVGDGYPAEISWVLNRLDTQERMTEGSDYTVRHSDNDENPIPDLRTFCLPYDGEFEFIINDSGGDGIRGKGFGQGYYKLFGPERDQLFEIGGNFTHIDTRKFPTPPNPAVDVDPKPDPRGECEDLPGKVYKSNNCNSIGKKRAGKRRRIGKKSDNIKLACPTIFDPACKNLPSGVNCRNRSKFQFGGRKSNCNDVTKSDCTNSKVNKNCPQLCQDNCRRG
ncbi:hypothetical protein FRACYDRAFT_244814 [Fragilariopsis cylindrus CCMP1102]|uniref:Peptidase M11 gametolysin domain-containing protein n=1 Tax=Fragilariopsis cylindrus CCMP1102 TaxID=635003 RepID=A0A1E7F0H8_9STRA|nr:hypothetical protein FRACYDRAFT_244814 [Fragilariopsis cylindrus CCMP1102]|eukprot:OEU11691.1 hypothetical protein FRACYDRAFT_244814 [Fragilariopsis cylindrus CCMP1102]